jgi:hypothetical protein
MDLAKEQMEMWARHNPGREKPALIRLRTARTRSARPGGKKGRHRIDLSKLRFQVEVEDESHYNVRDSATGLCFTVCTTETAARKRALELNRFTGNYATEKSDGEVGELRLRLHGPRAPTSKQLRRAEKIAMIERDRTLLFIRSKVKHFWAQVSMTFGNCWWWTGPQAAHGYGQYSVGSVHIMAHRYAYVVSHGPVPAGHQVTHSCGTRLCMNPDHLIAMTATDRAAMQRERRLALSE